MRLRQLGSTQSLAFFSPPEVHQSILGTCKKKEDEKLDSAHVIAWLLEQTCRSYEQLHGLYIAQGENYCHRTDARWENADFLTHEGQRTAYMKAIQRPERQSLEVLYGTKSDSASESTTSITSPILQDFMKELSRQKIAAGSNSVWTPTSSLEEVEQEREVELQVEEVRQPQKPQYFKALKFPGLHSAIAQFVESGNLAGMEGYAKASEILTRTTVGQKYGTCGMLSRLMCRLNLCELSSWKATFK